MEKQTPKLLIDTSIILNADIETQVNRDQALEAMEALDTEWRKRGYDISARLDQFEQDRIVAIGVKYDDLQEKAVSAWCVIMNLSDKPQAELDFKF